MSTALRSLLGCVCVLVCVYEHGTQIPVGVCVCVPVCVYEHGTQIPVGVCVCVFV